MAALVSLVAWGPAAAIPPGFDLGETPRLAPHRAVYEMTLGEVRGGGGVAGVSGRMVYEFSGSKCAGYALNMRLVTHITNRSGEATVTDLRSTTWEKGDGAEFRFTTSQYTNERLVETTSGEARREGKNGAIKVRLTAPTPLERELPASVLFPTQHSLVVLAAAEQGRRLVQAPVFDGSERGEKHYDTTAFIGPVLLPGSAGSAPAEAAAQALSPLKAWPVAIGYFDAAAKGDAMPSYELAFLLYANGVSRKLVIDYGDFVVHGVLSALDFLGEGRAGRPCP